MKLESNAFLHDEIIPEKYTCDGENISPPLRISEVPAEAKSLVLVVEDPDVPSSVREDNMWDHWLVWNIDPKTTDIKEGEDLDAALGKGTGDVVGYSGPCPPDREHRYFFYLYAVSEPVDLAPGSTKEELMAVISENIIDQAVLIGKYGPKKG